MNNKKGFTLVELLAVIAILAILVVVAMPNILKRFNEAKKNVFINEVKSAYKEATSVYLDNSLNGTNKTKLTSKNNDLDLDGESLQYCILTNTKGEVEYMKIGNGSFYTIFDGTKVIEKFDSSDALEMTDDVTFDCKKKNSVVAKKCYSEDSSSGLTAISDGFQDTYYTYKYKQQGTYDGWESITSDGYGVKLNKDWVSTIKEINQSPCSYINDKPIVSTSNMFYEVEFLEKVDFSQFDTTYVTNMSDMFAMSSESADSFVIDITNFNTENVTDMSCMFSEQGVDVTNWSIGDLSDWDVSSVTDMSGMFFGTGTSATNWYIGDLSDWDVSSVTNMESMFYGIGGKNPNFYIGNLSDWDVSNVTNMEWMFRSVDFPKTWTIGDLSDWETSKVTSMAAMFQGADAGDTFKLDLSSWDVSNVTSMEHMFDGAGADATNWSIGDLSNWNTASLKNCTEMFYKSGFKANAFNIGDIGNWNTSNVETMNGMFAKAGEEAGTFYIGNLSKKVVNKNGITYTAWDTSNVVDMSHMFKNAGKNATYDTIDLSTWDVSKIEYKPYDFNQGVETKIIAPNFN